MGCRAMKLLANTNARAGPKQIYEAWIDATKSRDPLVTFAEMKRKNFNSFLLPKV